MMTQSAQTRTRILFALVTILSTTLCFAGGRIDMGAAPLLGAYDQPFVEVNMRDGIVNFGPNDFNNVFLLDTGATSVIAVGSASHDLHTSGGDFNQGEFLEQGIGGFTLYQVSAPYTLDVFGRDSGISVEEVRILSDPDRNSSFGAGVSFEGIVGMPAMVDRVTTLDLGQGGGGLGDIDLSDLDALIGAITENFSSIGVSFSDTLSSNDASRYGIPARSLHFDPLEPGIEPTSAPLPIVSASHYHAGAVASGDNYILDTGAQLSFMSMDKIAELGLGPRDAFSELAVSGVGGITNVPVFLLDELGLKTEDGTELFWSDVQVIGLDLHPSIDGVIGSDLLTAGMLQVDLESFDLDDLFTIGDGPIERVHFDFRDLVSESRNGTGMIYLDLNPDFDVVTESLSPILAGDANRDLQFDQRDIVQVLQRGKYLTGEDATWGDGDWNGSPGIDSRDPPEGDGVFDQRDILTAMEHGLYRLGPYALTHPAPDRSTIDFSELEIERDEAGEFEGTITAGSGPFSIDPRTLLESRLLSEPSRRLILPESGMLGESSVIAIPEPIAMRLACLAWLFLSHRTCRRQRRLP